MKNLPYSIEHLNTLYKGKIVQIYHTDDSGDDIVIEQYNIVKIISHPHRRALFMLEKENGKFMMKMPFDEDVLKNGRSKFKDFLYKIVNSRNRLIFDSAQQDISF